LDEFFKQRLKDKNISYVETINIKSNNTIEYYRDDGIHASEEYHELIADLLFNEMKKEIENVLKRN